MRILRKIGGRRGATLGEMLVAVLILMLLIVMMAGGMGVAVKVYRTEKAYSDSRILANSILLAMTEELRYASGLTVGEKGMSVSYDSRVYGAGTTMELETPGTQEGGMVKVTYGGEGKDAADQSDYLYHENTYSGCRIRARETQPVFERDGDSVVISYDVCDLYGNVRASLDGVKIRLLNGEGDLKDAGSAEKGPGQKQGQG